VTGDDAYAVPVRIHGISEKTIYHWRVRLCVETEDAREIWLPWSEAARFETGLKDSASRIAHWIEADEQFYRDADRECRQYWKRVDPGDAESVKTYGGDQGLRRVPCLRKEFRVRPGIVKGRLYITARGFYEAHLNGRKIGPNALAPDFTAYDKCIYYQTYDITDLLLEGENRFDILLGDGWYAGHAQGIPGTNHLYGMRPALIMQAEIVYEDGTSDMVISDESFRVAAGPLQYADLFMGERYDMRFEDRQYVYGTVRRDYDKSVLVP